MFYTGRKCTSPNYKKAVCLFFKPAFHFLSLVIDEIVFILLGGIGLIALCSLRELMLQSLKKIVYIGIIAGKIVMPGSESFYWKGKRIC